MRTDTGLPARSMMTNQHMLIGQVTFNLTSRGQVRCGVCLELRAEHIPSPAILQCTSLVTGERTASSWSLSSGWTVHSSDPGSIDAFEQTKHIGQISQSIAAGDMRSV